MPLCEGGVRSSLEETSCLFLGMVDRKKALIMVSLVLTEVSEKESRRHLRYTEVKILKEDYPMRCTPGLATLTPDLGLLHSGGQHEN